jgi:hypothetical protein
MRLITGGPDVVATSLTSMTSGMPPETQPTAAIEPITNAPPTNTHARRVSVMCSRMVSPTYSAIRKWSLTQLLASC